MTEETAREKKHCGSKKKGIMLAYGGIQIGTSIISALSLAAIALGFCSIKQETKIFAECVEEIRSQDTKSLSEAVRYCNGGN